MTNHTETDDAFAWLEDIHAEAALDWVREHCREAQEAYCGRDFEDLAHSMQQALETDDNIPWVKKRGDWLYNFWRDRAHVRGVWRRTTWESYETQAPEWETLIDLDALSAAEDTQWVWRGAQVRRSDLARALIVLSPDGGDAVVHREFDLCTREFVPESEGGFMLPHAKASAAWLSDDALIVTAVTGPETATASTYPAQARILARGQVLRNSPVFAEVPRDHLAIASGVDLTPGFERAYRLDAIDFYNSRMWIMDLSGSEPEERPELLTGEWSRIDIPTDVSVDIDRDLILFRPRTDWAYDAELTIPAGALASASCEGFMSAGERPAVVYAPDASSTLSGWSLTRSFLILSPCAMCAVRRACSGAARGRRPASPSGRSS